MDNELEVQFTIEENELEATFEIGEERNFDCVFSIDATTFDYTALENKPQINGEELIGNKTSEELHLASEQALQNLDEKVDGINRNLTQQIEETQQDLNDKYNELLDDISDLSDVVDDNYDELDGKIDSTANTINQRITDVADELNQTIEENVVALQQEDTALQNQINTQNQTLTNHNQRITANANAIAQEILDRQSADDTLQDQIDNLKARGRFLSLWNATTGLAETNPETSPYTYNTGDYFIVGTVGEINYRPAGTEYIIGQPSTVVETEELATEDVYYFDGTVWHLQVNHGKTVSFANLAGQPSDNINLKNALDSKQETLVSGTNIKTLNNESLLGEGNIDITSAQWGNITGTLANQTDLQSALNLKANDSGVVHNTGAENISGKKTFNDNIGLLSGKQLIDSNTNKTILGRGTSSTTFFVGTPEYSMTFRGSEDRPMYTTSTNSKYLALKDDVDIKQNINDNSLVTLDKTVPGAINELDAKIKEIELFKFPNALIIGEPTINNGQISDFSQDSYLALPFLFDVHDRGFELHYAFRTGDDVTTPQNLFGSKYCIASYIASGKLTVRVSSNGTSWNALDIITDLDVRANTTYYIKLVFNRLNYTILASTNGTDYSQIGYKVTTEQPYTGEVYIGIGNNQNNPFKGIINLHKWLIKLNNAVIWQGMDDAGLATRADISLSNLDEQGEARFTAKQDVIEDLSEIRSNASTGAGLAPQVAVNTQRIEELTVAKFPNVVIIGTPHIEGGQVSNYSSTSYLQFPFVDISRGQPFDIYFSFTTANDITTQQNVLDSYFGIALAVQNGRGIMALSSNGTSWDIGTSTGTNNLQPNTTYYVKYSWTGTEYNASLSLDDQTYVPDMVLASNKSPHKTTIFIGGSPNIFGPASAHPFKGTINFNKSKVVVNGITVWEGMADVGLASRANVSLNNLDDVGEARFNAKQDVLTAGNGIDITNNEISTNTQYCITEDMFDLTTTTKTVEPPQPPYNASYGFTNITIHEDAGVEWVTGAIYNFILNTKVATSTYRNVRVRIGANGDYKPLMGVSSTIASGSSVFVKSINSILIYKSTYQPNGALHILYDTNTTYSAMTAAELNTGIATTSRTITAKVLGDKFATKQDILVSGTNIKTINNESILGSGNIEVKSAPDLDNITINQNASDELQAIGIIDKNSGNALYDWIGTKAEYDEQDIATQHPDWVCYITDDENIQGGLEIGTIGQSIFPIDESKNLRRYLNGQVISQSQFEVFTAKLKEVVAIYPNLACDETTWQGIKTASKLGQVGKFVIDDEANTIRLPLVINADGLTDLAGLGGIAGESLPNITGTFGAAGWVGSAVYQSGATLPTGNTRTAWWANESSSAIIETSLDASRSSSTYQDNAPIQQEAIKYPYFIQVANGLETEVDITREIELNNPYSLFDSKYSDHVISNASWLLSNGQRNSGTVYASAYEQLVKLYNGTETIEGISVKAVGDSSATDYDFKIDTATQEFILPTKTKLASGKAVAGNGIALGLTDGTYNYGMGITGGNGNYGGDASKYGANIGDSFDIVSTASRGKMTGITTDHTKSGIETSDSDLYLYFYVGETVQDVNLINAGSVFNDIATLKANTIIKEYVDGTSGYRIWASGYCEQWGLYSGVNATIYFLKTFQDTNYVVTNSINTTSTASGPYSAFSHANKTVNSVSFPNAGGVTNCSWKVCGYLAQGEF